jgi:hypothetical protein
MVLLFCEVITYPKIPIDGNNEATTALQRENIPKFSGLLQFLLNTIVHFDTSSCIRVIPAKIDTLYTLKIFYFREPSKFLCFKNLASRST